MGDHLSKYYLDFNHLYKLHLWVTPGTKLQLRIEKNRHSSMGPIDIFFFLVDFLDVLAT